MNANHHRYLTASLRYIDRLLGEAQQILASADSGSPFVEHTQDASPVERQVVEAHIRRVREIMERFMTDLDLPRPEPVCGTLWAATTRVNFAEIALHDLRPARLRGSGSLTDEDAERLDAATAELKAALDRLVRYLRQGADADLTARLRKLERTGHETPLLHELERMITAHGLVQLRSTLSMLLDAIEHGGFEIGVFGRTSSGKSSLLNCLLQTDVLPVGVTPVTAVPIRIELGAEARAVVEFAEAPKRIVEAIRLTEYSTEQHNPANRRRVTRIVLQLPAARLAEGVTFVDTPGLGSLATGGAEETAAYLPRCDLGLVLVDAGVAPAPEDLVLVQTLLRSGARVMVLLSKADLLTRPQRTEFVAYLREQLSGQLGATPPIHMVSAAPGEAALTEEWYVQALQPLLQRHREEAGASLRRKVGLLKEAVEAALQRRIQSVSEANAYSDHAPAGEAPHGSSAEESVRAALSALRAVESRFDGVGGEIDALTNKCGRVGGAIIDAVAAAVAVAWKEASGHHGRPVAEGHAAEANARQAGMHALTRIVSTFAPAIAQILEDLRAELQDRLAAGREAAAEPARAPTERDPADTASAAPTGEADGLPRLPGAPLFDAGPLARALSMPPPPLVWLLPVSLLRRRAETTLERQWRVPLQGFLDDYRRRLRAWAMQSMAELRDRFDALAAPLLTGLEAPAVADVADRRELTADLQRLAQFDALGTCETAPQSSTSTARSTS